MKELLNSFYMNSRTLGFDSQTTFFVKKTKKQHIKVVETQWFS